MRPYLGLRAFQESDWDRYLGRSAEASEPVDLWLSTQLLVLFGRSGVGKTSLMRAGVLPLLSERGAEADRLPVGRIAPGPVSGPPSMNPYLATLSTTWFPGSELDPSMDLPGVCGSYLDMINRGRSERRPLLCAIDQFEDLLNGGQGLRDARDDAVDQLARLIEWVPGVHLLVAVRRESLGDFVAIEEALGARPRTRFHLLPLEPETAALTVQEPLASTEVTFEHGAAEIVVERAQMVSAGVLGAEWESRADQPVDPMLLQLLCERAWEQRQDDVIRTSAIPAHLDGNLLLNECCVRAVEGAARAGGMPPAELWDLLATTFVADSGERRWAPVDVAAGWGKRGGVVQELLKRGVLATVPGETAVWHELGSDRLIEPVRLHGRGWPSSEIALDELLAAAEHALATGDLIVASRRAAEVSASAGTVRPRLRAHAELLLGRVMRRSRFNREAEWHLSTAAEVASEVGDRVVLGRARGELGGLYLATGRTVAAIAELNSATRLVPDEPEPYRDLARGLIQDGQRVAAAAVLTLFCQLHGGTADMLVERGMVYADLGQYEAAAADLSDAVRLAPALGDQPAVRAAIIRARQYLSGRAA